MTEKLRTDIAEYVKSGGYDALSFSLLYQPRHNDVPGREIQRIIDEEKRRWRRYN